VTCFRVGAWITEIQVVSVAMEICKESSSLQYYWSLFRSHVCFVPHVVEAQLYRLSTVDAHTDVMKLIHGKII